MLCVCCKFVARQMLVACSGTQVLLSLIEHLRWIEIYDVIITYFELCCFAESIIGESRASEPRACSSANSQAFVSQPRAGEAVDFTHCFNLISEVSTIFHNKI